MFADRNPPGIDPRSALSDDDLKAASVWGAPQVARPARGGDWLGVAAAGLGALALGGVTLVSLAHGRVAEAEPAPVASAPMVSATASEPPSALLPAGVAPAMAPSPSEASTANPAPAVVVEDPNQSRANPMIIDNSAPEVGGGTSATNASGGTAQPGNLSADELFAFRVGGQDRVARAQRLSNPGWTVVQGTLIPAVLETALNSDLPGYARAIVSRDVRGFDGVRVVIPRGSRLIGEYKSGLTTGQTRAHVVWTRLVRPDGVSVDLGSPGTDEQGQTGLGGRVDRHYAQRYGPAALLSLLSGIASGIGGGSSSTVVVGSTASGAAGQALQTDGQIPPTIRLPQGTPIQVFAARDLDFSGQ